MAKPSALFVSKEAVVVDPAMAQGGRGARKLVVTSLFAEKEMEANQPQWASPAEGGKCPVLVEDDWEVAVGNEMVTQDRHYHLKGTEIYMCLEGPMRILVEDAYYLLAQGDMLIVNPGAVHEVLREGSFLVRVITVHCGGPSDKFVV